MFDPDTNDPQADEDAHVQEIGRRIGSGQRE